MDNRTPIAEVVKEYVELKEITKVRLLGSCPFHEEKTPSFYVFTDTGKYHCFGCGEHGDEIDFICKYKQVDFKEAIELLGYNTEFKRDITKRKPRHKTNDLLLNQVVRNMIRETPSLKEQLHSHESEYVRKYATLLDDYKDDNIAKSKLLLTDAYEILTDCGQIHNESAEDFKPPSHEVRFTPKEVEHFWTTIKSLEKRLLKAEESAAIHQDLAKQALCLDR